MFPGHPTAPIGRHDQLRVRGPSWQRSSFKDQAHKGGKLRQLQPNSVLEDCIRDQPISLIKCPSTSDNSQETISMLEKRVEFLRSQHADTLAHLHEELDRLKSENRELNFKMVMCRCGLPSQSRESRTRQVLRKTATPKLREKPMVAATADEKGAGSSPMGPLEGELKSLRNSLEKANKRNARLTKVVEKMMQRSVAVGDSLAGPPPTVPSLPVNGSLSLPPEEYEDIIGHLQLINKKQTEEIKFLKKDLHDMLLSDESPLASAATERHTKLGSGRTRDLVDDPDLLYTTTAGSRVVLPYTIPTYNQTRSYDESYSTTVRLPPLARVRPSQQPLLPMATAHHGGGTRRKTKIIQRTKLGTFPR